MAQDTNSVTLVGRLTRDVEVRNSGETVILSMRLAVTGRKKVGDSWEDVPNYFDVTHFARSEKLADYLTKGRQIAVQGRLSWREWQDKEGTSRQSVEVIANDLQLLAEGKGGASSAAPSGGGSSRRDEDIPFAPSII